MSDLLVPIIIGLYLVAMFGGLWFIGLASHRNDLAIRKASEQRTRILSLIFKTDEWRVLSEDMEDVSFEDHYIEVRRGRDWRLLYSPRIQAVLAEREAAKQGVVLQ